MHKHRIGAAKVTPQAFLLIILPLAILIFAIGCVGGMVS